MKEKIARFLYGRYGEDALGRFLMVMYIGLVFINFIAKSELINIITLVIGFWMIYRMLSKDYSKRHQENEKYLKLVAPFSRVWKLAKLQAADKEHHYYICPNCGQICRIIKTKKKGTITCPKCYVQFKK